MEDKIITPTLVKDRVKIECDNIRNQFKNINIIINTFVREILVDLNVDMTPLCIKCDLSYRARTMQYEIGLYDTRTKVTVIKVYNPITFLKMGAANNLEKEINVAVRNIVTALNKHKTKRTIFI